VCKIALLGRTSKDTQVKQISTKAPNLVTAKPTDSVEDCMARMLTKGKEHFLAHTRRVSFILFCSFMMKLHIDIRHLPLVGEDGRVMGMISIKDLVKTLVREKEKTIKVLSDLSLGKGAHFGID
jgi:CBS domain-containing protein